VPWTNVQCQDPVTTPKPAAPPTTTTTATGTQAAPWIFQLDDAVYHKCNGMIACDTANASTAGEQTTWLDNARTDRVTSEPTLLPFVHLRQWFLKTLC